LSTLGKRIQLVVATGCFRINHQTKAEEEEEEGEKEESERTNELFPPKLGARAFQKVKLAPARAWKRRIAIVMRQNLDYRIRIAGPNYFVAIYEQKCKLSKRTNLQISLALFELC
jgi:hypothetical protein